jgi:phosphohistidine phosphatase SixA
MSSVTDSVLKILKTTTAKDILSSLKARCGETTQAVEKQLSFKKKFLVNETRK